MRNLFKCVFVLMVVVGCGNNDNSADENTNMNGHEYVDLGLPSGTLWATCNIGASSQEEFGYYFAWGVTDAYNKDADHSYTWQNYKWCNGSYTTLTKYCSSTEYGTVDNKTELESSDDPAKQIWGGDWQTPSSLQIEELVNNTYTTTTWTSINNICGRKIVSKINGNNIFLPSAEYGGSNGVKNGNDDGYYWSRTLNTSNNDIAYCLRFDHDTDIRCSSNRGRYFGMSIRPVRLK